MPRATIERILGTAQKTASWCNSQPWQVVITSGEATAKFRDVIFPAAASGAPMSGDFEFPREYRGVYLDRRRESGFQLYNAVGIARGDKMAAAVSALITAARTLPMMAPRRVVIVLQAHGLLVPKRESETASRALEELEEALLGHGAHAVDVPGNELHRGHDLHRPGRREAKGMG